MSLCNGDGCGGCGDLPDPQNESDDFNEEIMAFIIPCPRCDNPITILKKVHFGKSFGYILQCDHGDDTEHNGCGAETVVFGVELDGVSAEEQKEEQQQEEEEEEKEEEEKKDEEEDPLAELKKIVQMLWTKKTPFKKKKDKTGKVRYIYGMP